MQDYWQSYGSVFTINTELNGSAFNYVHSRSQYSILHRYHHDWKNFIAEQLRDKQEISNN